MNNDMNKLAKIFIICFFTGILFACEDKNKAEEDIIPYFGVVGSDLNQTFEGDPEIRYVTVSTNREFTVTSSDPAWCSVEIVKDKIDNLKIGVAQNKKSNERMATITISSAGFDNVIISVIQGGTISITTDKSYFLINNDNLEFSLKVTSSVPYEVEVPNWIQQKENTPVNDVYTFIAAPVSPSERIGNIVFKATDESINAKTIVSVVQRERVKKIGSWHFDDPQDLVKASVGHDLNMVRNINYNPDAQFLSVDGPTIGNKAVRIPLNCYFLADHKMIPKEGESYISEYTLFFEFKIPAIGRFYSLFQTNLTNTGDAEIFIRNTNPATIGVGATGYNGSVTAGEWHRLYLSFKPGNVNFFLDGVQITNSTTSDTRFRVDLNGIILCGGPWAKKDDNEFDVAEISIWNGAISFDDIKELEGIE